MCIRLSDPEMRKLAKELRQNGYNVIPGGKKFVVVNGEGHRVASLPNSAGDRRNFLNRRADLRRKGLIA